MTDQEQNETKRDNKTGAFLWDKWLLLMFIAATAILFLVLNREANSFMSDARLYPYVVTILGLALCALSVVRVLTGKEPNHDVQNGKELEGDDQKIRQNYKNIIGYLLVFTAFYFSIWLVGFLISAGVFMLCFMRYFDQSYLKMAIYAVCGLIMVEALSRLLQLELPTGALLEFFI